MRIRDFLEPTAFKAGLAATTKEAALDELVSLLGLDERTRQTAARILARREQLGSTGIGRGIALPHARTMAVPRLRLAFASHAAGLEFQAIDQKPVHVLFLILAPPLEVSNQYLPLLARIAQVAREPDVPERLRRVQTVEELLALLEEKGG